MPPNPPLKSPIVWIDLETTGDDPFKDTILEIAVVITDGLGENEVDAHGLQLVIHTEEEALGKMHRDCIKLHGNSGLIDACIASTLTKDDVVTQVMQYIKMWVPQKETATLAGNSIHFDRMFLMREMPEISKYLRRQQIDVTSLMIMTRTLYPSQYHPAKLPTLHRGMQDIRNCISYYKYYLRTFFRTPEEVAAFLGVGGVQGTPNMAQRSSTKGRHEPGGPVRRASSGLTRDVKPYGRA